MLPSPHHGYLSMDPLPGAQVRFLQRQSQALRSQLHVLETRLEAEHKRVTDKLGPIQSLSNQLHQLQLQDRANELQRRREADSFRSRVARRISLLERKLDDAIPSEVQDICREATCYGLKLRTTEDGPSFWYELAAYLEHQQSTNGRIKNIEEILARHRFNVTCIQAKVDFFSHALDGYGRAEEPVALRLSKYEERNERLEQEMAALRRQIAAMQGAKGGSFKGSDGNDKPDDSSQPDGGSEPGNRNSYPGNSDEQASKKSTPPFSQDDDEFEIWESVQFEKETKVPVAYLETELAPVVDLLMEIMSILSGLQTARKVSDARRETIRKIPAPSQIQVPEPASADCPSDPVAAPAGDKTTEAHLKDGKEESEEKASDGKEKSEEKASDGKEQSEEKASPVGSSPSAVYASSLPSPSKLHPNDQHEYCRVIKEHTRKSSASKVNGIARPPFQFGEPSTPRAKPSIASPLNVEQSPFGKYGDEPSPFAYLFDVNLSGKALKSQFIPGSFPLKHKTFKKRAPVSETFGNQSISDHGGHSVGSKRTRSSGDDVENFVTFSITHFEDNDSDDAVEVKEKGCLENGIGLGDAEAEKMSKRRDSAGGDVRYIEDMDSLSSMGLVGW